MNLKGMFKEASYALARLAPAPKGAVILMYHSVGSGGKFFSVKPADFRRQMRYLRDRGFNAVSLQALAQCRAAGSIPPKTVAVTFDDGYRDNYLEALPVLKDYSIPATVFSITGAYDGSYEAPDLPPLMPLEELRILQESGIVSIEPHSETHRKFTALSLGEAEKEVRDSKAFLERSLGKACRHFAYPKGRYDDRSKLAVKNAGISCAYGVEPGIVTPSSDSYALKRNAIDSAVSFNQFKAIVRRGRLRFR